MNEYRVWLYGKIETLETVTAESSFLARKYKSDKHSVDVTDVVAQRIWKKD